MAHGRFFIIIGPTGSGKSTLMKEAIARYPALSLPYSYTTRPPRESEIENDHYRFISREEFEQMIEEEKFLEWATYSGNYYGTCKSEVLDSLKEGKVLLKEMEVQGVRQVKEVMTPEELTTIFIDAGGWDELEKRVLARGPMTPEDLARRKQHHEDEMTFLPEADVVIENHAGKKDEAKEMFVRLMEEALIVAGA